MRGLVQAAVLVPAAVEPQAVLAAARARPAAAAQALVPAEPRAAVRAWAPARPVELGERWADLREPAARVVRAPVAQVRHLQDLPEPVGPQVAQVRRAVLAARQAAAAPRGNVAARSHR